MSKIDRGERRKVFFVEGLTLVEVMVGMLISAICLGTALQAYFGAVSIRAKSRQLNAVIARMEADAETIRQMSKETKDCKGDYVQALMKQIVAQDSALNTSTQKHSDESAAKSSSLEHGSLVSESVDLSVPQAFIFPASSNSPQDEQLTRKMDVAPDAPNVLNVSYTLTRSSRSGDQQTLETAASGIVKTTAEDRVTLAQLSLSVMPSAALLCP
jgi:Tfp pilus assembly protein PilE